MIFFTSDTHFGQQRTLELSKRPFENLDEMNETMVFLWNQHIGDNDTVYHLGDFGEPEFVEQLNGNIVMVPGNYDNSRIKKQLENKGVEFLGKKNTMGISKSGKKVSVDLVHEPLNADWKNFTLFGHVHGQKFKRGGLNVGVDCHFFRPLSIDDIMFFKEAVEEHYDENVFCE